MTLTFSNAPLIEIIAELQWTPPYLAGQSVQSGPATLPIMGGDSNQADEFCMRFGGEVYQKGFQLSERLVPPSFPLLPFQPTYRYRKSVDSDNSVLYQAGPGMFSANALPPYHSWERFLPVVRDGIEAMLKARKEKGVSFTLARLRYIDAFKADLTAGREIGAFVSEVLGIKWELPVGLTKHIASGKSARPSLMFALPLSDKSTMNIHIADGMVNAESAIIMDTYVSVPGPIQADSTGIMKAFGAAHDRIHEMFLDVTQPIKHLMDHAEG